MKITIIERYLKSFDTFFCDDNPDVLLEEAEKLTKQYDMISASLFQRRLEIGYARAARLLDQLEERGIIGPGKGSKPRVVLKKSL